MNEELNYDELHDYVYMGAITQYPVGQKIYDFEKEIARILKTKRAKIHLNVQTNTIIISLRKNRHVGIKFSQLFSLQELFGADDLVIYSPIRCELRIKIIRRKDCG